jgi:uncharacterized protein YndB with AHSA1/START domain
MTAATVDTEDFIITRTFAASRTLVWKAWTDPKALEQWWGPKGATIRVINFDFRPGGVFHYAMAYQPGRDIFGRFVYRDIAAPERMVWASAFSDADGGIADAPFPQLQGKWPPEVLNHMTLIEQGGKTTLTLRGAPLNASEEARKMFASMHESMRGGFGGTFEKLDAYLAQG